jgi:hypothetical protein
MFRAICLLILVFASTAGADEICAESFSQLAQTERLRALRAFFPPSERLGMVNATKGSYVVMETHGDKLAITFYTSGLFDLFPIKKEGSLAFCDTGTGLKMKALDRTDDLVILEGQLKVGDRGQKSIFTAGEMPDLLKRLHRIDVRGLASDH